MTEIRYFNMNASQTYDVAKKPISAESMNPGVYLWIIVGCSVGGAVILTMMIVILIYMKRRTSQSKEALDLEKSYISGPEFCQQIVISSYSSSESEDTSGTTSTRSSTRRPLGPSTSLDPTKVVRLTSECVQPRPVLTRWHTVASPHSQTTTVLGTVESEKHRGSDDDELTSPTCMNGRLWFSLLYKPETETLDVTLVKAKHLPGRGLTNTPRDPFVKVFLLPDEETFQQTKIRKRTLSPKFNETFSFHVTSEELQQRTLRMSIYDVDKRKIRHSLGHIRFPLARAELTSNVVIAKDLEITAQNTLTVGEIQISLCCNPFTNRIKANIGRLRNMQGLSDEESVAYVKVQLYHGHKLIKSKRTDLQSIIKNSTENLQEFLFDDTFHFAVSARFFDSCSFTFTVVLADPTPEMKDKLYGRVVIGPFMYARGEQLLHWQEMLTNSRSLVTRWHSLEPVQAV